MALLFMDSFDHWLQTMSAGLQKWDTIVSSSLVSQESGGRFGGGRLRVQPGGGGNESSVTRNLGSNEATLIVGVAYFSTVAANVADLTDQPIIIFQDLGTFQCELRVSSLGSFYVTRNGTYFGVGSANGLFIPNTWQYLELKVTFNNSTGTAEIRLNGVSIASASGVDTQNTANAYGNQIKLRSWDPSGTGAGANFYFDDLYVCSGAGGAPTNDFLGDVRVECILPNGNGNSSQLVGSDGNSTDNYLLVDETTASDADYVETSTVNDKDTYAFGNLTTTSGTVYGIQTNVRSWKADAGLRKFKSLRRLSGTEDEGTERTLSSTGTYYPEVSEVKPGGGAWTISDVNSAEFGYKLTV